MKQRFYERIGESVYRETLPNGLQVCVVPKPGYAKKYAFFATRYGGMDVRFQLDGRWLDTPAGIAQEQERQPGQQARAAAKPERRSRLR